MARVALLTLSDGRDVVARDVSEFRLQTAEAVTAALISAGHGVVRVSQPVSANNVATQAGRPLAVSQRGLTISERPVPACCATGADPDGPLTMQLLRLLPGGMPVLLADVRHCDADRDARDLRDSGQHGLSLSWHRAGAARGQGGRGQRTDRSDKTIELVVPVLRTFPPDLCTSFASPTNEAEGHRHASYLNPLTSAHHGHRCRWRVGRVRDSPRRLRPR